jgi:hypothetical protein
LVSITDVPDVDSLSWLHRSSCAGVAIEGDQRGSENDGENRARNPSGFELVARSKARGGLAGCLGVGGASAMFVFHWFTPIKLRDCRTEPLGQQFPVPAHRKINAGLYEELSMRQSDKCC